MIRTLFQSLVFLAGLCLATGPLIAGQPCKPFEGGRVDAEILATMREAARDGRLFRVDANVSKVGFCVKHFPFQEFRGEFTNIVGGLAFPPDTAQYGQALLLIHTASMRSNNPELEPLARGHDFMGIANYPEILFVGRRFEWLDPTHAHIFGELTLRGKTQPVIFDIDVDVLSDRGGNGIERIRLRGTSHVSRFNFGMNSYRFVVQETIKLCLAVELVPWGS
jgi:polyisoprenoid-binding protein YceI